MPRPKGRAAPIAARLHHEDARDPERTALTPPNTRSRRGRTRSSRVSPSGVPRRATNARVTARNEWRSEPPGYGLVRVLADDHGITEQLGSEFRDVAERLHP